VKGLAFKIDRDTGDVTFHNDVEVPSAVDLMAPSTDRRPREEAKAFLREKLKTESKDASELLGEAEQEGINRATLFAAKKELGVKSERYGLGGRRGKWVWHLPSQGGVKCPAPVPSPSTPDNTVSLGERMAAVRARERKNAKSPAPEQPTRPDWRTPEFEAKFKGLKKKLEENKKKAAEASA
jgi:hypothetical protein